MGSELTKDVNPRVERAIWRGTHKSARKLADELNMDSMEILAIKKALLDEVDPLTIDQQLSKAIRDLQEIASDAIERSKTVRDERNFAPMLSAAIGAIKTYTSSLERLQKANSSGVDSLNLMRQREIIAVFELMTTLLIDRVVERFDDADADEMFEWAREALETAAAQMEARNDG